MKIKFIKLLNPAEKELDETYNYYEYKLSGLGEEFIKEFRAVLKRISIHPKAWQLVQNNVRKCIMNKFPYNVIYSIEKDHLIILAISHQHRHPDNWKNRRKH